MECYIWSSFTKKLNKTVLPNKKKIRFFIFVRFLVLWHIRAKLLVNEIMIFWECKKEIFYPSGPVSCVALLRHYHLVLAKICVFQQGQSQTLCLDMCTIFTCMWLFDTYMLASIGSKMKRTCVIPLKSDGGLRLEKVWSHGAYPAHCGACGSMTS